MSVRDGLLAVLSIRPMHAYELRQEFERRTSGAWPLNMGQVSVTLGSLVKAGLVDADDASPTRYRVTALGRTETESWWRQPTDRSTPRREELTIKCALALADPSVDVAAVLGEQRAETQRAMHDLTRLRRSVTDGELGWRLTLDRMIFAADAEIRWLDHVQEQVRRHGRPEPAAPLRATTTTESQAAR